MSAIAYIANSFPEQGEPYVWEEIRELRKHGRDVICCSFRRPAKIPPELDCFKRETIYILPLYWRDALNASILLIKKLPLICDLLWRVVRGPEPLRRRFRSLAHTWLGACLAAGLSQHSVSHIHVHHGYFASWSGMIAARFLNVGFGMTLHGSDLLVRADYLDRKLQECQFCVTVSQFNRSHIRARYPEIDTDKLLMHRLGVDPNFWHTTSAEPPHPCFRILSVGRLHPVKDHEFLLHACAELQKATVDFQCRIAGDGPEHSRLERLIDSLNLAGNVELCGRLSREKLRDLYSQADVIVFTSRSEGIPLAAMEAMAMSRIVLAPAITGIPELIIHRETGFLYQPGSMRDLLEKLMQIRAASASQLKATRQAARKHVDANFNCQRNLQGFVSDILGRIDGKEVAREVNDADFILQQI